MPLSDPAPHTQPSRLRKTMDSGNSVELDDGPKTYFALGNNKTLSRTEQ
jgi:hypothetical protein